MNCRGLIWMQVPARLEKLSFFIISLNRHKLNIWLNRRGIYKTASFVEEYFMNFILYTILYKLLFMFLCAGELGVDEEVEEDLPFNICHIYPYKTKVM